MNKLEGITHQIIYEQIFLCKSEEMCELPIYSGSKFKKRNNYKSLFAEIAKNNFILSFVFFLN